MEGVSDEPLTGPTLPLPVCVYVCVGLRIALTGNLRMPFYHLSPGPAPQGLLNVTFFPTLIKVNGSYNCKQKKCTFI